MIGVVDMAVSLGPAMHDRSVFPYNIPGPGEYVDVDGHFRLRSRRCWNWWWWIAGWI